MVHYEVCEVNATFNLEDLVKDFKLSPQRREYIFLCHLFSIHLLDAYLGIESLLHITSKVDNSYHSRGNNLAKLISLGLKRESSNRTASLKLCRRIILKNVKLRQEKLIYPFFLWPSSTLLT